MVIVDDDDDEGDVVERVAAVAIVWMGGWVRRKRKVVFKQLKEQNTDQIHHPILIRSTQDPRSIGSPGSLSIACPPRFFPKDPPSHSQLAPTGSAFQCPTLLRPPHLPGVTFPLPWLYLGISSLLS